jgi:hypothetical protein
MSGLVEAGGMSRATEIVMKLWDYNQRVEIALPDEVAGVATSAS